MTRAVFGALAGAAALLVSTSPAGAATAPTLGAAESFAVLAGTTVTNTGATTVTGDLGVDPGSAVADVGTLTVTGDTHTADDVALQAQNDVISAYDALSDAPCTESFTGTAVEIGNQTLTPGVYCYSSSALMTGTLILDGDGVFIFKMGSSLTTAVNSTVDLINGAQDCDVFWQVQSSADLFTNTTFVGSILAVTSITLQNGTDVSGRALARNGAVTMDTTTVATSACAVPATPTSTASTTAPTNTPSPNETATAAAIGSPSTGASVTPPTGTTGPPPAAPVQPPAQAPPLPRLPNTGDPSPQRGNSAWLLGLVATALGWVILGAGLRAHRRP